VTGLSRRQWAIAVLALLALRLVIGFHFFSEGAVKLRDGNFDAKWFLQGATGPAAPLYHRLVDDHNGHWRLCLQPAETVETSTADGDDPATRRFQVDPGVAYAIWEDFVAQAEDYYRFSDPLIQQSLQRQLESAPAAEVPQLRSQLRQLTSQSATAADILKRHRKALDNFLESYRAEIIEFAHTAERARGFLRDGRNRQLVAWHVPALAGQIETIKANRAAKAAGWFQEVETIWDSLETQINDLPLELQRQDRAPLSLHRPYQYEYSPLAIINRVIPWFDLIVGSLLLLGLLTRLAASAAIVFLLSVVMSQPFWVWGAQDTWLQWIELAGLTVLLATSAGRYGGLDFFLNRLVLRRRVPATGGGQHDHPAGAATIGN